MMENRVNPRYPALAHARITGMDVGNALLRDLSITGCRLEFSAAIALSSGKSCRIIVIPEAASAVSEFELEAEPRWNRAGYDSFEIGFQILSSPKGKEFQRYVDYLAWRAAVSAEA